jgi:hypothetical protein
MVQEAIAVLGDAESLPRWWPSVYLSVVPVKDAAPDGTGRVVDLHTKGWAIARGEEACDWSCAEGGHWVPAAAKDRCHRRRHRPSGGCCTNATAHSQRATPDRAAHSFGSAVAPRVESLPAEATPVQRMSAERGRPAPSSPFRVPGSARPG